MVNIGDKIPSIELKDDQITWSILIPFCHYVILMPTPDNTLGVPLRRV